MGTLRVICFIASEVDVKPMEVTLPEPYALWELWIKSCYSTYVVPFCIGCLGDFYLYISLSLSFFNITHVASAQAIRRLWLIWPHSGAGWSTWEGFCCSGGWGLVCLMLMDFAWIVLRFWWIFVEVLMGSARELLGFWWVFVEVLMDPA